MKLIKSKILLLFFTILICFILGEISIRILASTDLDNNVIFSDVQLKPYKLPKIETEKKLQQYSKNKINSRLLFDKNLGWKPHENFISSDRMYIYNKYGIRSASLSDTLLKNDAVKIAIFGDSYVHGDEVKFNETIGHFIEEFFLNDSINVEILNFGVSGYGMDQAYLRWECVKDKIKPDFVILGVQLENTKRNINIIRPLYSPITEIPFSKPRFILHDNKLTMLSNPSDAITYLPNILDNFNDWKLKEYEGFFDSNDYGNSFVYSSELISFASSAYSRISKEHNFYTEGNESYIITNLIIDQFKQSVRSEGNKFIAVHLPVINDFAIQNNLFCKIFYDQDLIYESLVNEIKVNTNLIETYPFFKNWIGENSLKELFMERHYSPLANKLIAKRIYNYLKLNYKIFSRK